jgi:hypothetical protein
LTRRLIVSALWKVLNNTVVVTPTPRGLNRNTLLEKRLLDTAVMLGTKYVEVPSGVSPDPRVTSHTILSLETWKKVALRIVVESGISSGAWLDRKVTRPVRITNVEALDVRMRTVSVTYRGPKVTMSMSVTVMNEVIAIQNRFVACLDPSATNPIRSRILAETSVSSAIGF